MKPLLIHGEKTNGLIQTFLATLIFFSPNFLFLLDFFKEHLNLFLFYNFIIIFLLVSVMTHDKFSI